MVDKDTILQVICGLMKNPTYLSETDKYYLTIDDFTTPLEKYVFSAIYNLYKGGAQKITVVDIDNYFNTHKVAKAVFEKENGIEYLQDALDFSQEENFPFYYRRLKKFRCLDDLNRMGFDTHSIYETDLTNPKAKEINDKFENLDVGDIFSLLKKNIMKLESEYSTGDASETTYATKNVSELVESLRKSPEVGLSLQGDIFNTICRGARPSKYYIRSAGSGTGKALPNSVKIPTPNGWKVVQEIKVGDYLFDAFGKPTKVLGVYPQGIKEVFEVIFKDGRSAKCCNEHLWSYNTVGQRKESIAQRKFYTNSLKEISEMELKNSKDQYKIIVPMQKAVEYNEKNHYIPSYIFGLILGDGSFRQHESNKTFQYSSEDNYLPKIIADTMNWNLKKGSLNNFTWYFSFKELNNRKENVWVEDVLKEHLELMNTYSDTKFIPREYIEDSIQNRFDLLSGLLDSDGSVDKKGRIRYYTTSYQMVKQVEEIAQSLGFKTNITMDNHKLTSTGYTLHLAGKPEEKIKLFRLPKKRNLLMQWYNNGLRKEYNDGNPIVEIRDLGYEEEMTCFYVDNKEHLFLTENFVVTHNTRAAVGDACALSYPIRFNTECWEWEWNGASSKTLFIATEQELEEVQTLILAYLTGFNEEKILYGQYNDEEWKIVQQAIKVMEIYKDNLFVVRLSNPNIAQLKAVVRQNWIVNNIENVFYDYIFSSPSLLNEFRDLRIREDRPRVIMSSKI